jgi:hypothetical protein
MSDFFQVAGMKKKEFVTQDLLSKIYQNNDAGPRKLPLKGS